MTNAFFANPLLGLGPAPPEEAAAMEGIRVLLQGLVQAKDLLMVISNGLEQILNQSREAFLDLNDPKRLRKSFKADVATKKQAEVNYRVRTQLILAFMGALLWTGARQAG
jgi:hypothetical protein